MPIDRPVFLCREKESMASAGGKLVGIDLGHDVFRHRHTRRSRPARDAAQSRRRNADAQRRLHRRRRWPSSARPPSTWPWNSPTKSPRWSSGACGNPLYGRPVAGREFRPETLSAIILRKLVQDAELRIGPVEQSRHHRAGLFRRYPPQGHQDAGRIAGLATCSTFSTSRPPPRWPTRFNPRRSTGEIYPDRVLADEQRTVLVYDLGGGTFDVTLVRLTQRRFETLAIEGRRPPGRQGLGRSHHRSCRRVVFEADIRPIRGPIRMLPGRPHRRRRARQADAQQVAADQRHLHARRPGADRAADPGRVRDPDARSADPHAADDAASFAASGPELGQGRPHSAGRRLDAHADDPARCSRN